MKKLITYLLFCWLFFGGALHAQQFPLTTQYLFNPYVLNQAMAGYYGYSEVHLNFRREWVNIQGGPQTFRATGFGAVYQDKMWLGGEVYADKLGAFSTFKASLSYSYILQTGDEQQLFFGVWGNYFQNSFNVANAVGIDPNDPLIANRSTINGNVFNGGFGLVYNWYDLNIGFAFPNMIADTHIPNATTPDFSMQREFLVHVSNIFSINDQWQMMGEAVYRKVKNEPSVSELSAMAILNKQFWTGLTYRTSGVLAINIGGYVGGGILFDYAYELGTSGINRSSGGTHEISLSIRFGMSDSRYFENKNHPASRSKRIRRSRYNTGRQPRVLDYKYRSFRR
jgi:type IX secretion system PorP/SprF family membrane protein